MNTKSALLTLFSILGFRLAMENERGFKRLPKYIRPINYELTFRPDLEKHTFEGHAKIKFTIDHNEPLKAFELYSSDLDIRNVLLDQMNVAYSAEPKEERIKIEPKRELSSGNYTLDIEFSGLLNDKMHGFYRSTYQREGKQYTLASTQFEPAYARKAFPCWDEPSFKATFDVTIEAPKDLTVLSNMPVASQHNISETLKSVNFARSPIMSTYLLAFVVGPLEYIEGKDSNGVVVRVYTPIGNSKQGEFALTVACKTLPYYADYFGITYQLPKLDLVAVPDFAAGAMENWGLVTYRETAVLIDPDNSAASTKQYVALVVAHELAHQWFGNLVTMDWWTDLWLNEGFASWIEYLAVDALFPELNIWTQFVFLDLKTAQNLDALANSHPIEVEIVRPNDVEEIFDSISYSKGATVIRMLHDYLGDKAFKKGLQSYLQKFKFRNAETRDLWISLTEASDGIDVAKLMHSWTSQMGFPLVNVKSSNRIDNDTINVTLTQSRYLADGSHDSEYPLWYVPITVWFSDERTVRFLLTEREQSFQVKAPLGAWFKLNADYSGMYVTAYPQDVLETHLEKVGTLKSVLDRFNLQTDLFSLCMSGDYGLAEYLKLVRTLATTETDFTVWRDIETNINYIGNMIGEMEYLDGLEDKEVTANLDCFKQNSFDYIYKELGFVRKNDSESDLTAMLRVMIIKSLGLSGEVEVIKFCTEQFVQATQSGVHKLDPNLRLAIYVVTASRHGVELFDDFIRLHQNCELSEEKNRLLAAMGQLKGQDAKERVLEYIMSPNVRYQDVIYGFQSVANSDPIGRRATWKFFIQHFDAIMERYKESSMMGSIIKRSFGLFFDDVSANEINAFFKDHPVPIAERAIEQMIEGIVTNGKVLERNRRSITDFLKSVRSNNKDEL